MSSVSSCNQAHDSVSGSQKVLSHFFWSTEYLSGELVFLKHLTKGPVISKCHVLGSEYCTTK